VAEIRVRLLLLLLKAPVQDSVAEIRVRLLLLLLKAPV